MLHHSRDFACAIPVLIQMRLSLLEKNRFLLLVRVVEVLPDVPCLTDRFQAQTTDDSFSRGSIHAIRVNLRPSLLYHRPFCLQLLSLLASRRSQVSGLVVVRIHRIVLLIVRIVVRVGTM